MPNLFQVSSIFLLPLQRSLRRASIRQKISLGYALAIGVAVVGSTIGHVFGDFYPKQAAQKRAIAHREEQLLMQLNLAVLEVRAHQQQLIPLLGHPQEFEYEHQLFSQRLQTMQALLSEVQASVIQHSQFNADSAELVDWFQTYDGTTEDYIGQFSTVLRQIDQKDVQPSTILAGQESLLKFTNGKTALQFDRFADDLKILTEQAHSREVAAEDLVAQAEGLHDLITYSALLLSVILAVFWAAQTSQAIAQPLESVTQIAQQASEESKFDLQAPVTTTDEVGQLATSFNRLIAKVADYTKQLELEHQTLEQRVESRTQALQQTIKQLEHEIVLRQQAEADLTREKIALHQSEERFRQLADNINDVFWIRDPQKRQFLYVNPAFETIWGRSRTDLYDNFEIWIDAIHPSDQEHIKTACLTITTIEEFDEEYRLLQPDGTLRWIRDRGFPIKNKTGEIYCLAGLAEDITERKKAEQEIHNALEKERELNELRARFITTVSHEFRTPLTVIVLSADLVQRYTQKMSEEKRNRYFEKIQSAIKSMTHLLDEVLLISKASAGKLHFNPTSLNIKQWCEDLLEDMQTAIHSNHEIQFIYQEQSRTVLLDEQLLHHILVNLLSNAIKYSPQGGVIKLEVSCDQNTISFTVQDEGIGIPQADQTHIFELFHRGENASTISGAGLGLCIVKNCVDLHQGEIKVESQLEVGTQVTVTLPFNT